MKEMIKKMREEKDGFTIAELLIVVAIIAVLVAIAIPVFTSSLNSAHHGTATANVRSYYSECATQFVTTQSQANPVTTDWSSFVTEMQNEYSYTLPADCAVELNDARDTITVTGPGGDNVTTIRVNPDVWTAAASS